jgi:hypothetical protein
MTHPILPKRSLGRGPLTAVEGRRGSAENAARAVADMSQWTDTGASSWARAAA